MSKMQHFRLPADKLLISTFIYIMLNVNIRCLDRGNRYYLLMAMTASIPQAPILSTLDGAVTATLARPEELLLPHGGTLKI